jgi:hypothetical protein
MTTTTTTTTMMMIHLKWCVQVSAGGGDLTSCQFCGTDSIPSTDQTRCVTCPAGSSPSFDLTSCTSSTPDDASASPLVESFVVALVGAFVIAAAP